MGVVYHAKDPVIGRAVAVKTLQLSEEGTGLTRTELLARFQTEARAAGLLTHPNIVVIYDAGEEDGLFFITMELVEGKSLQNLIDAGQMFPLPRVLRIMEQACGALQFAHDRNIVHRDIKPANLMLTPDDTVKVTDFGTAKILQFGTVQQTAHVVGTPSYMSPEQIKGKVVDGRSDIFSLGVVLYEMVTGEKPFPGQNITTVIYKIVNEDPAAPRDIDSSIHPGLNSIILKSLAKEPAARYQSCRELFDDLRNYRSLPSTNPNATLPAGGLSQNNAASGSSSDNAQLLSTSRSLNARTPHPSQTPAVRRTGAIAPAPEARKSNTLATVLAAILLLSVIVFGARKIRPVFQAARQQNPVAVSNAERHQSSTAETTTESSPPSNPSTELVPPSDSVLSAPKPTESPTAARAAATTANSLSPAAAQYKARIERAAAERHLRGRLSIKGSGMTLMLSGKLRPAEHSELLQFLHNAPAGIQVVDDVQYDDSPYASSSNDDSSRHPPPVAGRSAIHIITNVIGATASLGTNDSSSVRQCETPCAFAELPPGNYSLQVLKSGFQPVRTALQLEAGKSIDQRVQLEALAQGLFVASEPSGADVFINGDKQSGQTPLTLPLAPGKYNLVLRLPGYDAYSGPVLVRDDGQAKVDAQLHQKGEHIAWAQVESIPDGAEIWVDGTATGQHTPSRVQVSSGIHNIILKLNGYLISRNTIQVSEGGTVNVSANLNRFR
jgi:serine/threonine-protein kinase